MKDLQVNCNARLIFKGGKPKLIIAYKRPPADYPTAGELFALEISLQEAQEIFLNSEKGLIELDCHRLPREIFPQKTKNKLYQWHESRMKKL